MALTVQLDNQEWQRFQEKEKKDQHESRERLQREYADKAVAKDKSGVEGNNKKGDSNDE